MDNRRGFTLIELLVASTIFVSLMGLVTIAFGRISNGGKKGLQVLELHTKADSIIRFMEQDIRSTPNVAAIHLQQSTATDPGTLTFMRQVTDTHPAFTNKSNVVPDFNPFESADGQHFRLTDLIWVRWQWQPGVFERGQSRINQRNESHRQWAYVHGDVQVKRYTSASRRYIHEVDLNQRYPMGIQTNAVPPMLQRHYDFFVGKGGVNSINTTTGASAATAGQKIQVYKVVGGNWRTSNGNYYSEFFDEETSPWRIRTQDNQGGDVTHLYTTLDLGNDDALSDANAYAVRNMDGNTVNKDRLNLVGAEDTDAHGQELYPSQIHELFDGVEFMELELVKRDGSVLGTADETDRMSDGASSLDISGVEPLTGDGIADRPIAIRASFLLHSIPMSDIDESDHDNDGDDTEPLMNAVRDIVIAEGNATRLEDINSYKRHALKLGHTAIYFNHSVQLGY